MQLTKEFFTIALPAFIQLTAEPLASLVDTAYLGRLGPEVLGGAGVAISSQYAVSKLYNDPLLRTSISLVANQDGKQRSSSSSHSMNNTSSVADLNGNRTTTNYVGDATATTGNNNKNHNNTSKELSVAVSSALLLAFTVGFLQLFVYVIFASTILKGMGYVI